MRRPRRLWATTRDGWKLALYRYVPISDTSRWGPVLLVHGLGANRHNLDAPVDEISLARYLNERGHDVWVVELRGSGRSRPPGWPLVSKKPFDFDDYVLKDIPAVIRRVLDLSNRTSLHWVGHSMGGMLAYTSMIHFDQRLFRSVTTIGSPVFTTIKHPLVDQLYRIRGLLHVMPWLPLSRIGLLGALLPQLTLRTVGIFAANADHMELSHVRKLARLAMHDLPAPLLRQFAEWYGSTGGFKRNDGLLDYWQHLDRVRAPLLIVAGPRDQLSPVKELKHIFESVGSSRKRLLVASRAEGFSGDYGHIDLILGRSARAEIYPHIARWIEES